MSGRFTGSSKSNILTMCAVTMCAFTVDAGLQGLPCFIEGRLRAIGHRRSAWRGMGIWRDMGMILYRDSTAGITAEQLQGFFEGWPNPPSPETHLKLLANSDKVVLAIDEESGKVVGFITAITDGVLSAYISFLEVLPTYRGRGIGRELVRRMLEKLAGLYAVDLLCDPDLQPFYKRFGMRRASGMSLRNYQFQSGS